MKIVKKHKIGSPILDDFREAFGVFFDTVFDDVSGLHVYVFLLVGWCVFFYALCCLWLSSLSGNVNIS